MKRTILTVTLLFVFAAWAAAQSTTTQTTTTTTKTPTGTHTTSTTTATTVAPKPVKVTPGVVRAAQQELARRGDYQGKVDGIAGPRTSAAIREFQQQENLRVTGRLDAQTLAKLNVGGEQVIGSAPADLGRGGKALGHDVREGHPIAGAKAMGEGTETFGKRVGQGSKALAERGAAKVGHGLSSAGHAVENKTEGKPKTQQNPPPQV